MSLPAMIAMDNEVLQQDDKSTLGGTNGEEQITHPNNPHIIAQDENPPPIGLFQDEAQSMHLLLEIWNEIWLAGKKIGQQFGHEGQVL